MNWIERDKDETINIKKLNDYKLPVIKNIEQLVEIFGISKEQEKIYFYKEIRKKYLYKEKLIPKKTGGQRKIEIPINALKEIQRAINNTILNSVKIADEANAYIKKRSIVTNALPHVNSKTLIKIDIRDFFPSINFKHVYKQFRFFGYGKNVAKYLSLLCVDGDLKLPQGAPTSPTISNIICIHLDSRIGGFCKKLNLAYTRYADDITISSKRRLNKQEIYSCKNFIYKVLRNLDFEPNDDKFKCFYNGKKLEVTGIVVNNKLSVPKKKIREIENAIRYIDKYGLEDHVRHINVEKNNYVGHLFGLANYIKMIDKEKGIVYLEKLNKLKI